MKRKIISLLLCLVMALSLIPTVAFADRGGGGGGVNQPSEAYFKATDKFGYDAWEKNGSLTGLSSVKVGNIPLAANSASSTTGDAVTNGITVNLEPGYYITQYKYVCGDKYNCRTDAAGKVIHGGEVKPGDNTASVTLTPTKTDFGHSSEKGPYWLLLELGQDTKTYTVSYNWGELADKLAASVPVDTAEYLVSQTVTVKAAGDVAIQEALTQNYKFTGWKTDFDTNIYQSDGQFGMPQKNVTLTAQWEKVEPETTSITVTKVWNDDDVPNTLKSKSVEVQLLANDEEVEGKTLTLSTDHPKGTFEDLPENDKEGITINYTVKEVDVPDGYSAEVTGSVANGFTITNTAQWDTDKVNPASLTIKKVDKDNKPLSGAEFTLRNADGTPVGGKALVTSENGTCTFTDLTVGTYMLEETKAPEGYEKSNQIWTIMVQKDEDKGPDIVLNSETNKFQKVYDCTVSKLVDNEYAPLTNGLMTITNDKEPEFYTVTLPIQKIVDKKVGSDNPGETKFTFVATKYDEQTEKTTQYGLGTITTKGVGTYNGTLKIEVPANLFTDGNDSILLQVSEVKGTDSKWSYDKTVYRVLIYVQDSEVKYIVNPQIALRATADQEQKPTTLTFTNVYSYKYTPAPKPTTPAKPVTSVKTGDMGVALYAGLAILSMTGSAGVILRRRKNDK